MSSALRGLVGGTLHFPTGHVLQIVGYGAATAVAFGLTFAALARIGASHTAVVMTLEAASTVVIAAAVLGEGITLAQGFGGLLILAAAAVIARSHRCVGPRASWGRAQNAGVSRRVGQQTRTLARKGEGPSAIGSGSWGGRPSRSRSAG
jgi:EamA-like transporter family